MKLTLVVSTAFNILLFLGAVILGVAWKMQANATSDINDLTKIRQHSAIVIASIIEGEIQGFRKQQIDDVISKFRHDYNADENCFHLHKNGIRSRCLGYPQRISSTEVCLHYEGVYFLFKEDRFVYFDRGRKCSAYPINGGIFER